MKNLLSNINYESIILDEENALILKIDNLDMLSDYEMIHVRNINNKLVEMNEWNMSNLTLLQLDLGSFNIPEFGLYIVLNTDYFDSLYDYKNAKFIVPKGEYKELYIGDENRIKQYNGVIGRFNVESDNEYNENIIYNDPITNQKEVKNTKVVDGNYFTIINLDGTIRDNLVFKGEDTNKIEEIIDLSSYGNLSNFKTSRKFYCNREAKRRKSIILRINKIFKDECDFDKKETKYIDIKEYFEEKETILKLAKKS